ncbi:alpha/beta hydrolase family protein [Alicyclobacillus ferrooxydans]|uniref:Peptidase S9 prolyl oligopeptidase catalytic domain-containing protein n=1 Tax=Alicyclobacillus ferrooxydans TaxID=471514 RepID=A0A0P9EMV5_9BACL|nr:prolyl oligopeptidase family serine peptidase [Alicyclobacillus ferrooxydans]KPV44740.1 hypothetical protein AN477_05460 [Alicyclobacillus ferrooxydans]
MGDLSSLRVTQRIIKVQWIKTTWEYAGPQFITLIPEYGGYAGSGGTVQGLHGDTLDTNNAIQAVMSRYSVEQGHVYLEGASMGGGVVLQLAEQRHDVRSVIALSPFVGMQVVGQWAVKNKNNSDLAFNFYGDMLTYGTANPNSPLLSQDSVDYKKIKVPVLLLQGTADHHVAWQTVQMFYNDLKPYDNKAKLILFPGGHHGLHGENQSKVNADIRAWYRLYGEYGTAEN